MTCQDVVHSSTLLRDCRCYTCGSNHPHMTLLNSLNWRYAVKVFEKGATLSPELVEAVLEAGRMAPSSYGLQPFRIVRIKNPETREKLRAASYDQSQITDASELLVLCRVKNITEAHIQDFVENISAVRGVPLSDIDGYKKVMTGDLMNRSAYDLVAWASKQIYIILGVMLTACADLKVDACPMEGFIHDKYDEILGLEEMNLASVVVLAMGARSVEDKYAHEKKVRMSMNDLLLEI